ncbi:MAG: hypothetical protein JNL79_12125 [Myxococcales bacterium]|nr:hypothetical protein [Myxococcales bacterium]
MTPFCICWPHSGCAPRDVVAGTEIPLKMASSLRAALELERTGGYRGPSAVGLCLLSSRLLFRPFLRGLGFHLAEYCTIDVSKLPPHVLADVSAAFLEGAASELGSFRLSVHSGPPSRSMFEPRQSRETLRALSAIDPSVIAEQAAPGQTIAVLATPQTEVVLTTGLDLGVEDDVRYVAEEVRRALQAGPFLLVVMSADVVDIRERMPRYWILDVEARADAILQYAEGDTSIRTALVEAMASPTLREPWWQR